ncbi:hypothetical protein SKC41_24345 [Mycobacterium sp. 050128]|uniref:hypothetical protein n=1 Tax=Mycobacterium sp. 050128 TaxID=3096112 RepID=UPI002ED8DC12
MYLSAERLALANHTIKETFEHTSIAWQAIPHWDTGDPGQSRVPDDVVNNPGFLNLDLDHKDFQVTLVQTVAPTPDSLIAEVNLATTQLAQSFDQTVLWTLALWAFFNHTVPYHALPPSSLLSALIEARAHVEDQGYRAPSCLVTNTQGLKDLSDLSAGYPVTDQLLAAAHVNSLHRTSLYDFANIQAVHPNDDPAVDPGGVAILKPPTVMVMVGRRQLIAHGGACYASPGEEPVDIAVSVLPSLEVVGETVNSQVELSVRIRFALRVKDPTPLVLLYGTPVVFP